MSKWLSSMMVGVLGVALCAAPVLAEHELLGAGATFPFPYYSKLFSEYSRLNGVKINYQSIGSGGGIQQLKNKTVNFGASDAFLSETEKKEMPAKVVHIPTCLGAVAITYNLPGMPKLKLTPDVVADIFLGKIQMWNDPRIAKLNPTVKLPAMKLVSVHRSDGSGTTSVFTEYLAAVSPEWKAKIGAGKSVPWPSGMGGKGNSGVAGLLKQLPGSVGYIEHIYAIQNKMPVAALKNKSGAFIEPNDDSVSAAADTAIPADTCVSLVNTPAKTGYPISSFTWLLVYEELSNSNKTPEQAQELVRLLSWVVQDGQAYATELGYAPLPKKALVRAKALIATLKYNGKVVASNAGKKAAKK